MLRTLLVRRPALQRAFATAAGADASPLLAKYGAKLQAKAERDGFASVAELLRNAPKQKPAPIDGAVRPPLRPPSPQPPPLAGRAKPKSGANQPSYVKTLDDIVDLTRFEGETADRIEVIWNEFHAMQAGMVSGVMQADFYAKLKARGKEHPLFILPLPRESGVEFFLLQFSYNQIYYTPLLEYKTHLTEARPCLTLTHYDELADSKKIVLMRGETGKGGAVVRADDARLLVLMTQSFYVTGSESKRKLVEIFNKNPSDFNYQTLIDEMDKLE
ncbi:ATP11 protein-domain-containing protein [Obelidium mucronatum]|nr:ATP11 protein-domain-containing protein [Obelidium mucronatum]